MQIIKRDGTCQEYDSSKIKIAIKKAFIAQETIVSDHILNDIVFSIENEMDYEIKEGKTITVEWIQDHVEIQLMKREYFKVVRAYIIYREQHKKARNAINRIIEITKNKRLSLLLKRIQKDYNDDLYDLSNLQNKFETFIDKEVDKKEALDILIRAAVELISKEAPNYEYIASRILNFKINENANEYFYNHNIFSFYEKIKFFSVHQLYGSYLLENYSEEEINELETYIDYNRDNLFTYSGIELLADKYLIKYEGNTIEKIQDMFMAIAMHMAMKEEDKLFWAKEFYDALSSLKLMIASPTLYNSRKPIYQLASNFVNVVPDDLQGIYKSLDIFAEVSKYGGGMGIYFGKVRASGSKIGGINGSAAGVCKWTKLVNDTILAVEQYGERKGACSVYLDVWHKDIIDFLSIKNNNSENKSPDIYPAICFPDLFWKMLKNNINGTWYLLCPQEVRNIKGYALEDYYGNQWEEKYWDCIKDERINKKEIPIKEMLKHIFKIDEDMPIVFNRDIANKYNPNKHKGIIYCSSLYGELAQNTYNYEDNIAIDNTISSNLASLNLSRIDINNDYELKHIIDVAIRLLDNVIDLNDFLMSDNQKQYRCLGLGVLGYNHCLVKNNIEFESKQHLSFVDQLFEKINLFAINASCELAKQRGPYAFFKGSEWENKEYFKERGYLDSKWLKMADKVAKYGLRNAYLLAISPTTTSSIIAGTTGGIEPIIKKFYWEDKNDLRILKIAPDMNNKTFWLYKNACDITSETLISAAKIRQRHLDQSQALSLFIKKNDDEQRIITLLLFAFSSGIKTIHLKLI